jgi:predicted flap endonuclease-1-like 5' DNA nuclease
MDLLNILIVGVAAFLVGFILEWIWDSRRRKRDQKAYQQDTAELYSALERANAAKSAAQKEANSVLARADGLQLQKERLEKERTQMRAKVGQLSDELDGIQVQLRQMTAIEQANETLRSKLTGAEGRVRELEAQGEKLQTQFSTVQTERTGTSQQISQLQATLERAEQNVLTLQRERDMLHTEKKTLRDRLAAKEEELATIGAQAVASQDNSADIDRLIAERDGAHNEINRLRSTVATMNKQQERAAAIQQENDQLMARLESAENELLTEHNRLVAAEIKLQNMADALTDERMKAQQLTRQASTGAIDNAARLQAQLDMARDREAAPLLHTTSAPEITTEGAAADRLQLVNGIGNVFAQRFNDAGVYTFEQLAALGSERIVEIVQAKSWQKIDAASWIAQARELGANRGTA